MKVGIICEMVGDFISKNDDPWDIRSDMMNTQYLNNLISALYKLKYDVVIINQKEFFKNIYEKIKDIDYIVNMSMGYLDILGKMYVPAILDILKIPYLGSDPYVHSIVRHKAHFKMILKSLSINTPDFVMISSIDEISKIKDLEFPVIVKPCFGVASVGIDEKSCVKDENKLEDIIFRIINNYKQPAIIETFIEGREISVPIIGNNPTDVWGIVEIIDKNGISMSDNYLTSEIVYHDDYNFKLYPTGLFEKEIKQMSLKIYNHLGFRDYGRLDFRINDKKGPFLIEGSTHPHLDIHSDFLFKAQEMNLTYSELLSRILATSFIRNKINVKN